MPDVDFSWFYSSLAQCTAAVAGLLTAVLILRLQAQSAAVTESARGFALAVAEAGREFARIQNLVAEYRAYADIRMREVREAMSDRKQVITVSEERTLTGRQTLDMPLQLDVSQQYLARIVDRKNAAFQLEYAFQKIASADTAANLHVANIYLKQANAQLAGDDADREFARPLIHAVATAVDLAIRIRAAASVKIPAVITALIVWLSVLGLIVPLYALPATLDRMKGALLAAVSLGLLAVPAFVAYELYQISKAGAIEVKIASA